MNASMRDVAARAGVSVATVSNVLNRPDRVAPATRQLVEAAIAELGFVPNASARQLRAGHSRMLGLVVPDIANPFFADVARGVERVASGRDHAVLICDTDSDPGKESRYLQLLLEQRFRGVLVTPTRAEPEWLDAMQGRLPVVLLDRESATGSHCSVSVDDVRGGMLAIAHLVELGHRRIAWLTGPSSIPQCALRGEGVRRAAADAHVEITEIVAQHMTIASGAAAAEALLGRGAPTAVFCANDLLALGALQRATSAGVAVPAQLSVLGYDDVEVAAMAAVPLSSIAQPAINLGTQAAKLLLAECERPGDHAHQQVLFQPRLAARASTGPPGPPPRPSPPRHRRTATGVRG